MSNKLKQALILGGLGLVLTRLGLPLWHWQQRPRRWVQFKGQVALITGASSGIGKALAEALAAAGCHLVLAARRGEQLERLSQKLEQAHGIHALVVPTDVSDPEQVQALVDKALNNFGQIDMLFNNAGISSFAYFHQEELAQMERLMAVNYWGVVYCTQAVLPGMLARRQGLIVNVSSVAGKLAQPGIAHYSASKHALNGLSDALRMELAPHEVRVLLLCPTSTQTEIVKNAAQQKAVNFNPERYFGMSAQRVARETLHAILDRKTEHVLGAAERLGIAGRHLFPRAFDAVLGRAARYFLRESDKSP